MQKSMPRSALAFASFARQERLYLAPHPNLRESISHYTFYAPRGTAFPDALTIVPDASGSIVCRLSQAHETQRVETWFWGPSSRAVVVENNPAKYPFYIMVEFLPCGAHRLLGIPMSELHNAMIPLHALDTALHKQLGENMERLATNSHSIASACASLDATFLLLLAQGEDFRLARHVVSQVRSTSGTLRVTELARQLGYSPRQVARVMSERLGMPVKLLARTIRINAACQHMNEQAASLTEVAHSLHYHDQSHFIHDFTDICGVTPGEYLLRMSHFYNEELKLACHSPQQIPQGVAL